MFLATYATAQLRTNPRVATYPYYYEPRDGSFIAQDGTHHSLSFPQKCFARRVGGSALHDSNERLQGSTQLIELPIPQPPDRIHQQSGVGTWHPQQHPLALGRDV